MSLILDVPTSVEFDRAVAASRSNSKLSAMARYLNDRWGYKREHHRAVFADSEAKKKAAVAPDNGRDRTDADAGIGMPLHASVFIERLTKLNPSLWFERANADKEKIGIYLQVPISMIHPEGLQYLFAFHDGIMPEFVLLKKPDANGEGTGILRQGWRTVLARLVRLRMISLPAVEVMFGQPSCQSAHWAVLTGKRSAV